MDVVIILLSRKFFNAHNLIWLWLMIFYMYLPITEIDYQQ